MNCPDIQSWWEIPYVAHFCSLFSSALHIPRFDIEDLEAALLHSDDAHTDDDDDDDEEAYENADSAETDYADADDDNSNSNSNDPNGSDKSQNRGSVHAARLRYDSSSNGGRHSGGSGKSRDVGLLTLLILKLLRGCHAGDGGGLQSGRVGQHGRGIRYTNYQMFLRRLLRRKCSVRATNTNTGFPRPLYFLCYLYFKYFY